MQKIAILDLGTGNIASLSNRIILTIEKFNKNASLSVLTPQQFIEGCNNIDKLILPGVGNFAFYSKHFFSFAGLEDAVKNFAIKKHILGICVGMQFLLDQSTESGINKGLGLIKGNVEHFTANLGFDKNLKVPHMGWNNLLLNKSCKSNLFANFEDTELGDFYFVHSYYCKPADANSVIAFANYSFDFAAAISCGFVHGVQFHPEKSSLKGELMLDGFLKL